MSPSQVLYFDYHATTPVDPRVVEAMLPVFSQDYGNSMSVSHAFGWEAEKLIEKAREQVAKLVGCAPKEITFTSGATESNNWAFSSLIEWIHEQEGPDAKIHFLVSPIEHSSVLAAAKHMQKVWGVELDWLPINSFGQVDVSKIEGLIKPHTRMLAAMWAQNEVGSLNPVAEIGEICHRHRIFFLCDATQAIGKIPVDLARVKVDLLSFSAHKLYGPKGIGFLYQRSHEPRIELPCFIAGGGHERGFRSGTLNTPAIVGMGKACELAAAEMQTEAVRMRELRDRLFQGLQNFYPKIRLNGHPVDRLPHNLHVTFGNCQVPPNLKGLAVSRGSACFSGKFSMSETLRVLGFSDAEAGQSLRISLGRMTRDEEIDLALDLIRDQVRCREQGPEATS